MPSQALEFSTNVVIISIDNQTGDVTLDYTLILKNVSSETLEKVILKDFVLPADVAMSKGTFEMTQMRPGEVREARFQAIVRGWGLTGKEQTWQVTFTTRIERGSTYTEETSMYEIQLSPK